jgi:BirA family biotin operon repressor/biotin-[acetyl-CoA-carboxylase] ligase
MSEDPTRERFDLSRLRRELGSSRFGHPLEYRERVASTNDRIFDMARRGAPEGTISLAEEQTAGRGRQGHSWFSPPYLGIWTSVLLRPRLSGSHLPPLTLCAAYAVALSVEQTTGVPVEIKWPNDILIHQKKVGGILAESKTMAQEGPCLIVGIGINVNHDSSDFPESLRDSAISLRMATGHAVDRSDIFCKLVETFEKTYQQYLLSGLKDILPELSRRLAWRGALIQIERPTQPATGRLLDLVEDGSLMVETEDQGIIAVQYGAIRLPT